MSPRIGLDIHTILNTAINIADHEGISSVSLAALAKKLNIRPPSLYNHLNGLADLRKKLALSGIRELGKILSDAAIGRAGDDAIYAMGEAYITFARNNPGLYEATFFAPDMQDTEIQKASDEVVQIVIQVLQHYALDYEESIHATRGLRSILHGFATIEQKGGFAMGLEVDKSFQFLIRIYLDGLKKLKNKMN